VKEEKVKSGEIRVAQCRAIRYRRYMCGDGNADISGMNTDSNMSDDANNFFNWSENKSKLNLSLEQEITHFLSKSPTKI